MSMEARSELIISRTYAREKEDGTKESWPEIVERVKGHQRWLWEEAQGKDLNFAQEQELSELAQLMLEKKISMSGRTLWLGGTEVAKKRAASQFNCSFTRVETVHDVVDGLWLLMQGCGLGFSPVVGSLSGFSWKIPELEIVRSKKKLEEWPTNRGRENNVAYTEGDTWTLSIGDSAEAWAKGVGKLLAFKGRVKKVVIDLSEIRPSGIRLKGYGWISSGDETLHEALEAIFRLLNNAAGKLLSRIEILDLMNWLGTVLSSRRSAEIGLFSVDEPEWEEFAVAKREYWINNKQRAQSNNSLLFNRKPAREQLEHIFSLMLEGGGCEPGFINGETARKRAPWFAGINPCAEILLANKGFCNLVEVNIAAFLDMASLHRALYIAARANYRQTCVNLRDGILQDAWHQNNEHLRLCGVGLTGIAQRDDLTTTQIEMMKSVAKQASYSMADELNLPRAKNVTTVKPSGSLSKIMGTTEGVHKPLGKYIINRVVFGKKDPMIPKLRESGYLIEDHPTQSDAFLVAFPIVWENIPFEMKNGIECNLETAVQQLERYKKWQIHWCDQNVSNTISYSPDEVPAIIDWFMENWEHYVGVSFLFRCDPTMTAAEMGVNYLPQTVVTKEEYEALASKIKEVTVDFQDDGDVSFGDECASGVCPIK